MKMQLVSHRPYRYLTRLGALAALSMLAPGLAWAADAGDVIGDEDGLPKPRSDNDPRPPVAKPSGADAGVTAQAGIGGTQAYGRPGVMELGGSFGFNAASDYRSLSLTPTLGWFFVNNVEVSGLISVNNIKAGGESTTLLSALIEPSLHLPLTDAVFVFGGVGFGLQHADGPGTGFAVAPRLGMNLMVGRSGVFTPAFNFNYSTTDAVQTSQGTLLAVSMSYGLNAGYTVMW
jgi:hypothetical protein